MLICCLSLGSLRKCSSLSNRRLFASVFYFGLKLDANFGRASWNTGDFESEKNAIKKLALI